MTIGRRGEEDIARYSRSIAPSPRVGQEWPTLALPAMHDSVAEQAAVERTGTYLPRVTARAPD